MTFHRRLARSLLERRRSIETVLLIAQALGFLGSVLIARGGGPHGRGVLSALTAWTQLLGWASCLSLDKAIAVLSPPDDARGASADVALREARRMLMTLALVTLPLSLAVGIVLFDQWVLAVILAVAAAATARYELWSGYLLAIRQTSTYLALRLMQPSVYVAGLALVVAMAGELPPASMLPWFAIAFLVSVFAPLLHTMRKWTRQAPPGSSGIRRALLAFGVRAQVAGSLQYVNARLDLLLLPLLVSPHDVGVYAVALGPAQVLLLLGSSGVFRGLTGETERRDLRALGGAALAATAWIVLAPIAIPAIFGSDFQESVNLSRILILAGLLGYALGLAAGRLLGLGQTTKLSAVHGTGAVVFGTVLLIGRSVEAAAWGNVISYGLALILAECLLGFRRPSAPSAKPGLPWFPI